MWNQQMADSPPKKKPEKGASIAHPAGYLLEFLVKSGKHCTRTLKYISFEREPRGAVRLKLRKAPIFWW